MQQFRGFPDQARPNPLSPSSGGQARIRPLPERLGAGRRLHPSGDFRELPARRRQHGNPRGFTPLNGRTSGYRRCLKNIKHLK